MKKISQNNMAILELMLDQIMFLNLNKCKYVAILETSLPEQCGMLLDQSKKSVKTFFITNSQQLLDKAGAL